MKTNYIKQIVYDMRHHPMVTWINILGTALAIFLLMVIVEISAVKTAPFRPESNRDRMLHTLVLGYNWEESGQQKATCGEMSYSTIQKVYGNLSGAETVTAYRMNIYPSAASLPNEVPVTVNVRAIDEEYFKVFDLKFIEGKPFDASQRDNYRSVIVISETLARRVFGSTDVVGKELLLDYRPYKIVGVVEDVSSFASNAYSDVWRSISKGEIDNEYGYIMGNLSATILAKSRYDIPNIRKEIQSRYASLENELKEYGFTSLLTLNQPLNQEEAMEGGFFNNNIDEVRMLRYMLYALFLLIPAINIGSMTNSRMRQRLTEMAVMRSYGCTRLGVMRSILVENLIVTIFAGVLGMLAVVAFAMVAPGYIFNDGGMSYNNPTVNLSMLIHWSTFFMALGFCFVLNLLSTGIPAWRASRLNIVNSLRGNK